MTGEETKIYKLVIIDDEVYTCEGLKKIINWAEYKIEVAGVANDGEEGMQRINEIKPDIVITDINMPLINGLDMIEMLRKSDYNGKVIILTGYRYFEYAKKAIENKVSHYLLKPIDVDKLKAAVIETVYSLDKEDRNDEADINDESEILKILKYVNENYAKNISLNELSSMFYVETSTISKMFKQYTGKKFIVYINEKRIEKAQGLLRKTKMSIEDVMFACGYMDMKHFRKLFKEATGKTPTEYRKLYFVANRQRGEKNEND